VPQPTVLKILQKQFDVNPYMLQMVQVITEDDKEARCTFCFECFNWMEDDLLSHVVFSDESIFCISGYANHHDVWI
jgi:hypothetical protein